jgi:hypothetical protein
MAPDQLYHVRLKTYDLADAEIGRRGETASKGGFPSAGDCVSELASVTRRGKGEIFMISD